MYCSICISILLYYTQGELVAYKKKYGNCNVSQVYESNKLLGKWVNTQQTQHNKGTLTKERIKLLEGLGF